MIVGVAFSPDGRRLVSAALDRTVKIWDVATGQELRTLWGHTEAVLSVAFSPNGQWVASAGSDQTVRVWDAATAQELVTLRGHTNTVQAIAFHPQGRWLASAAGDETVKVWDATAPLEALTLHGHTSPVTGIAFSPDSRLLATASHGEPEKQGGVLVWEAETGKVVRRHDLPPEGSRAVTIASGGKWLAAAALDQTVKIWDVATGKERLSLPSHPAPVQALAFSGDGKWLASGTAKRRDGQTVIAGEVKIWDTATGKELVVFRAHPGSVTAMVFSPDGNWVASAGGELPPFDDSSPGEVKLWEARTGRELVTIRGLERAVLDLAFSPDGQRIAAAGSAGTVKAWERTWELQRREDAIDRRATRQGGGINDGGWTPATDDGTSPLNPAQADLLKKEKIGPIPPPPKYKSADFQGSTYWRLRGSLDVPKERWVIFPHCQGADGLPLIAWAGYDHLQLAKAIAAHYVHVQEQEGGRDDPRLVPLLACLIELLPWLKQWHNEIDPEFNMGLGDYFEGFVQDEARQMGRTMDEVRAWQPPVKKARSSRKAARSQSEE